MTSPAITTLSLETLHTVCGGQQASSGNTMSRTEAKNWLQACAKSSFQAGLFQGKGGEWPSSTQEVDQAALKACNAGVADYLSSKK